MQYLICSRDHEREYTLHDEAQSISNAYKYAMTHGDMTKRNIFIIYKQGDFHTIFNEYDPATKQFKEPDKVRTIKRKI